MKKKRNGFSKMISILFVLAVCIPVVTLGIWMFAERWAWPDFMPQVFSTRALRELMGRKEQLIQILGSGILISTMVGIVSVVIGIMTSRALVLYEFQGKNVIYFFTILPFMVPAAAFGMGVQMTFIKLGLNNTVLGVITAHLICSLPYVMRLLMEGMEASGTGLEEQARVLGASSLKAFIKVTLPILMPVIVSAMSMSYIVSFSQYFLTLLIGGGRVKTFTIVMVPYLQGGDRNIACVYSMVFLGITLILFAVFEKIANKWSKGGEFYA